jgi:hypothetical protein
MGLNGKIGIFGKRKKYAATDPIGLYFCNVVAGINKLAVMPAD